MKRNPLLVCVLFLFSLITPSAFGQEESSAAGAVPLTQVMSAEEARALRQDLQVLAQAMGVESGATNATTNSAEENIAEKSVADVADRALTLVNGLVIQLSQTLETVAPELWRVMIRQQYAKAVTNLVVPWGTFLFVSIYWFIARKRVPIMIASWDENDKNNIEQLGQNPPLEFWGFIFGTFIPLSIMFCTGFWGINRLADSAALLINPEYYAVRDIMLMLLNPQGIH